VVFPSPGPELTSGMRHPLAGPLPSLRSGQIAPAMSRMPVDSIVSRAFPILSIFHE